MTNYKEGSGRGRFIQYGNTLKMAARQPLLGVGPGNWPVYYPRFMSPGDPSFDADDIIPVASERGFPALLLIALVGITTALGAWTRVRHSGQREPELADLTIVTTLLALGVIGSFDAVLLLPVPTFFGWIIIGTLTSTAKPIREVILTSVSRRWALGALMIAGLAFVARSVAGTAAMELYDTGKTRMMELGSRLDPGSYRLHMFMGALWLKAGRCERARPHAESARRLFPNHPAPLRILRSCGGKRR